MGGLPKSKEGLQDAGYVFDFETHCRACGALIEFWITPRGKRMPMDVIPVKATDNFFAPVKEFERIAHWASCPNAKDFRRSQT